MASLLNIAVMNSLKEEAGFADDQVAMVKTAKCFQQIIYQIQANLGKVGKVNPIFKIFTIHIKSCKQEY